METLEFKWTVSRGRDTYGYNICTLYVDGTKSARCNGGGYDMKGTCLGDFIARAYSDRLRALKAEDMPEQSHWEPSGSRYCRGKCHDEWNTALVDALVSKADAHPELKKLPQDCFECPDCGGSTESHWNDGKRIDDGRYFYGLTFHDPNFDPSKAIIGKDCHDRTLGDNSEGKTVAEAEAEGKSFGLERYQAFYVASSKVSTERHTIPQIDGGCGFSSVEQIMKAIGLSLKWIPQRRNAKNDLYILNDKQKAA